MPRDENVEIPSLTLDQDEVSERRATASTPKRRLNPPPTRAAVPPAGATAYKKPSLVGVYILLILILAAASGAGYWLWQQNMQLRAELSSAKGQIENLDHQFLAADVSANKQGETVEQTLKNHDSEIRKLWGVAYDTNRKTLAAHTDAIAAMQKKLSIMNEAVSTQSQRVAIQSDAFNELEANYNKLIVSVAELDKAVKPISRDWSSVSTKLNGLEKQVAAQKGQGEAQALSLDQASQDIDSLEKKLDTLANKPNAASAEELAEIKRTLATQQDAINAIDAFRSQMNAQVLRLNKQINQLLLQQQLSSGAN
ncbi:hypothetical protein [Marinomonas pollencensis]|uniref:Uroporphyrin-3 C-methyltransferase n=1 Tax=Marinomonas pollencensis TaxID=491954 RepID=A0A3E0DQX3_9GAMM|nr:hypothetical protein [Marinomonas pollencensis]REG85518.1 hypothetical protein DFP81_10248 [Marinomonas pollencensis]